MTVIVMTLITGAFVTFTYLFQPDQPDEAKIERGLLLPALIEDWGSQEKTIILALSTTCIYCTDSAGFYRTLVDKFGESKEIRIIGVFSEEKEVGEKYLQKLGVKINFIEQASLADINVVATPTIILIDKNRRVVDSWVGKLNETSQTEVLKANER